MRRGVASTRKALPVPGTHFVSLVIPSLVVFGSAQCVQFLALLHNINFMIKIMLMV